MILILLLLKVLENFLFVAPLIVDSGYDSLLLNDVVLFEFFNFEFGDFVFKNCWLLLNLLLLLFGNIELISNSLFWIFKDLFFYDFLLFD